MSDNVVQMEMERAYNLRLTETEMTVLANAVRRLYTLESKDNRLPKESTFQLMRALDKFAKIIDGGKFLMIKKERLPV